MCGWCRPSCQDADREAFEAHLRSGSANTVLFICEKYYLRFYRPVAAGLAEAGFRPIWITVDALDQWDYEYLDPRAAIEDLTDTREEWLQKDRELCVFERAVFERPELFRSNYAYTMNVVRTLDRARRFAPAWYEATLAFITRFRPRAVCVWNGRYLP